MKYISVTPDNIDHYGLFCTKNPKLKGFQDKKAWYIDQYPYGLRIHIAKNSEGQDMGFIEFTPIEHAWRPVVGQNLLFIQCVMVNKTKFKGQGVASYLIQTCEEEAVKLGKDGVCVLTSDGTWLASKRIFENRNYQQVDSKGRFELMLKDLTSKAATPSIIDWEVSLASYQGWHLIYTDQCPFLYKSVIDLMAACDEQGIDLQISKINNSEEAKMAPNGYGVYTLIHDGKILQDHYVSKTRFKNILKKELVNT